jgi:hypothetical protein
LLASFGRLTVKVVPTFSVLEIPIVPPWAVTLAPGAGQQRTASATEVD